jgi:hypothetical protein
MVTDDLTIAGVTKSIHMMACGACVGKLVLFRRIIAVAPVRCASVENEEAIQTAEIMPGESVDTAGLPTDTSAVLRFNRRRSDDFQRSYVDAEVVSDAAAEGSDNTSCLRTRSSFCAPAQTVEPSFCRYR